AMKGLQKLKIDYGKILPLSPTLGATDDQWRILPCRPALTATAIGSGVMPVLKQSRDNERLANPLSSSSPTMTVRCVRPSAPSLFRLQPEYGRDNERSAVLHV
ncbi:hypothetical protein MPER_10677, partial [Moniliophthora perniciosa FA553]